MTYFITILVSTLVFAISQGYLIRQFRHHYSRPISPWPEHQPWPKAAIIVSLRGGDPFLETCLRNLLKQDYPDFFLQVIVDSETDPAWNAIRAVQADCEDSRLLISVLQERRSSCSLKNSSIIQAIRSLPADREVVAFVDADAITHSTWLRELVTPLADPGVGCATGVRWFAPTNPSFATRLRCFWNLMAASMIYHSDTPWGGSMVVRRSVLDSGLAEEWSQMFCEDAHTINHLQLRGLKLVCVPQATVVNTETTDFWGCVKFVNRQMLIFRLYHRQWPLVVVMIMYVLLLRIFHYFFILKTLFAGEFAACLALIAIRQITPLVAKYEAGHLDQAVRTMVAKSGQEIPINPVPDFWGYFCAEALFFTSMLSAMRTRFVSWRGIKYKVNGPRDIVMLAYQPFFEPLSTTKATRSTII